MQDKAADCSLGQIDRFEPAADNYKGPVTDSYAQFLAGAYAQLRSPQFRRVLCGLRGGVLGPVDHLRRRDAALAYRPTNQK